MKKVILIIGIIFLVIALAGISFLAIKAFTSKEAEVAKAGIESFEGLEDELIEDASDGATSEDSNSDVSLEEDEGVPSEDTEEDPSIIVITKNRDNKIKYKFSHYNRDETFNYLHGLPFDSPESLQSGIAYSGPDTTIDAILAKLDESTVDNTYIEPSYIHELLLDLTELIRHTNIECDIRFNGDTYSLYGFDPITIKENVHVNYIQVSKQDNEYISFTISLSYKDKLEEIPTEDLVTEVSSEEATAVAPPEDSVISEKPESITGN